MTKEEMEKARKKILNALAEVASKPFCIARGRELTDLQQRLAAIERALKG